MKTLTLRCDCGRYRNYRGPDAGAILREIDDSGWDDRAYLDEAESPRGLCPGRCPTCWRDEEYDDE